MHFYNEKQTDGFSCGRQALNNLLQAKVFVKNDGITDFKSNEMINYNTRIKQTNINSISLCKFFTTKIQEYRDIKSSNVDLFLDNYECDDKEHYTPEFMISALQYMGHNFISKLLFTKSFNFETNKLYLMFRNNYIISPDGTKVSLNGHWFSIRYLNDKYYYIEPLDFNGEYTNNFTNNNELKIHISDIETKLLTITPNISLIIYIFELNKSNIEIDYVKETYSASYRDLKSDTKTNYAKRIPSNPLPHGLNHAHNKEKNNFSFFLIPLILIIIIFVAFTNPELLRNLKGGKNIYIHSKTQYKKLKTIIHKN